MGTQGRILVIDDELGIREGCVRVLQPNGYSVETAATLKAGGKKIRTEEFDLVLLDVMMPDGRGIELLETIHEKDPDLICVIITGYATVELAVEAIKQGAYDFISKPFNSELLLMTVNQGLEKRRLSQEAKRLQEIEQQASELAREKTEMEKLDRLKTTFMLTVAHELRSPVSGAQSLLRTLLRGLAGELNEQQSDILNRIEKRLDFLLELIEDLLSLASSKTFDIEKPLEEIDLLTLLKTVVGQQDTIAESKGVKLILTAPEEFIIVMATEDGLGRIFTNLIGNAVKYTPAEGQVEITVNKSNSNVKVTIADTGIGIPQDDIPHLWEEFFRAKNARRTGIKGTGLGLSIVKQYIEQFKGQIEVKSVEGEGTEFTLILPLV